ncbi:DUF58 domain-containing protein [Amphritea sp. 2_MG-2023]|uniref:DUF58 domain-containing protein n=1 Tax=Amphritea TaxID=515417 RepID=UPI001C07DA8B|nr:MULTISPECIES: DUF58 domain-containing protein [Amphritea]MBU2965470.1 DUF58 domain-containing protein [Amphritea atlantica]MDO6418626.1 DUF58 domain-containing protein [Amphritea sp. 2_MG-2023]
MIGSIRQRLSRAVFEWSLRRSPRLKKLTLSQRRIYIMPSRSGFMFLLLLLVMLVLAINFQNNLMFAVTFLLASLFVVTILHTYANLSGLTIEFLRGHPCFEGEQAAFDLLLTPQQRQYESIQLRLGQESGCAVDLLDDQPVSLTLYQTPPRRGMFQAGPLLIETYYPLGLFRAWTWLQVDLSMPVYPRPVKGGQLADLNTVGSGEQSSTDQSERSGGEEFAGLVTYEPGMSLKRVAWKHYARGQGMHAKEYVELRDHQRWLSWELWPELNPEARLSRLTWWLLQLHQQGEAYGLDIPGCHIQPNQGESHRLKVLTALACFGLDEMITAESGIKQTANLQPNTVHE